MARAIQALGHRRTSQDLNHQDEHPDPTISWTNTLDARAFSIDLFERWTQLWNLKLDLAPGLLAPTLVLHYAQGGSERFDDVDSPEQLINAIRDWHKLKPGIRFEAEGEPCVDASRIGDSFSGMIARPYNVSILNPDGDAIWRSGTDILKFQAGLICEVWSVSSGKEGRSFRSDTAWQFIQTQAASRLDPAQAS